VIRRNKSEVVLDKVRNQQKKSILLLVNHHFLVGISGQVIYGLSTWDSRAITDLIPEAKQRLIDGLYHFYRRCFVEPARLVMTGTHTCLLAVLGLGLGWPNYGI
jgi:hypothetical protein